jgi:uncharacterized protein YbbC (DUF1343 family)
VHGGNVKVVISERPNLTNGVPVKAAVLNREYRSFVSLHRLPVRHGRTIGERARSESPITD